MFSETDSSKKNSVTHSRNLKLFFQNLSSNFQIFSRVCLWLNFFFFLVLKVAFYFHKLMSHWGVRVSTERDVRMCKVEMFHAFVYHHPCCCLLHISVGGNLKQQALFTFCFDQFPQKKCREFSLFSEIREFFYRVSQKRLLYAFKYTLYKMFLWKKYANVYRSQKKGRGESRKGSEKVVVYVYTYLISLSRHVCVHITEVVAKQIHEPYITAYQTLMTKQQRQQQQQQKHTYIMYLLLFLILVTATN